MDDTYRRRKEEWVSNHEGCPSWESFSSIATIPVSGNECGGGKRGLQVIL
jgi:hypothetical protein